MDIFALIEDAMQGVRVVDCDFCDGEGEVGLPTLRGTCPQCKGRRQMVTNELEVEDEAES